MALVKKVAMGAVALLALTSSAQAAMSSRALATVNSRHRLTGNFHRYASPRLSFSPVRGATSRSRPLAAQFGGDLVTDTVIGGVHSFLQIYNLVLTVRILLSWFPNVARQPALGPIFVVTEPFFGIFRGLIPPIGGIDLSPLPAFFLLSWLTSATETLGAEIPSAKGSKKLMRSSSRKNKFVLPDLSRFRVNLGKEELRTA